MVLVVDDSLDLCKPLILLLKLAGIAAECVTSGKDAIEFVGVIRPKLIILDYNMPEMNGVETLREIRGIPELTDVTVFFFTASNDETARMMAIIADIQQIRRPWYAGLLVWLARFMPLSLLESVRRRTRLFQG